MSYYYANRIERLEYQKFYNILNNDKIKEYQKQYYLQHKKSPSYKPLANYKIERLERMLRRKLRDYKEEERLNKIKWKMADSMVLLF